MKKITIIALHLSHGGIENYVSNLANILSEKYDVEIIATYKLGEPAYKISDKVKIKYLTKLKPNKKSFYEAKNNKNILKMIKEFIKAMHIVYVKKSTMIKAAKNIESDIIITTREIHNEIIGKYASKNIIKIASDHNHHNNNQKYINGLISSLDNIDYFMPVSKELYDFYKPLLKNTKIKYISHMLDNYPEKTSNLKSNNILSVGRLEKVKKIDELIKVFAKMNTKYTLNIAGDGLEKESLEKLAKEHNLEKRVNFLGYQSKEELEKLYLDTSLFVLPSESESFGLVLIEAMSYKVPVIAFSDAKGVTEIIENNKNGVLLEERNYDKLQEKIEELMENESLRNSLGEYARKYIKKYTKESISEEWFLFIESL